MNSRIQQYPFYFKSTVILLGLVILCYVLSSLQDILSPVAFAILLAILLNPLVNRLRKWKVPQVAAILISMLIATICVVGVIYFLSSQIMNFTENLPGLKDKLNGLLTDFQIWLRKVSGISIKKQLQLLNETIDNNKAVVGQTLGTVFSTLSLVFLVPVYIFLLLLYKNLILNFFFEVFVEEEHTHKVVSDILNHAKVAIQSYMVGLLLEALAVATLNSIALLILGVKYAVLLGIIGAILNILPYIGGIIAIALPVFIATVTKDGYSTQIGIVIAYLIIQFIDNNVFVPRIVSAKVQINALLSIIIVLLGGALWGIGGMFLSIPFAGIMKIIFDRIDELKPWGKLLGDQIPTRHWGQAWRKRRKPSVAENVVKEVSGK